MAVALSVITRQRFGVASEPRNYCVPYLRTSPRGRSTTTRSFGVTTTFKVLWTVWDALMKHFSTWIGWTSWPARLNLGATERRWRY